MRFVDSIVDELDLSEIESRYSANGRRAYAPRMLVKLLVYGTMRGIRSSRELSRATKENIRVIFLVNKEQPDFRTINRFRKDFSEELAGILKQTVRLGLKEGLITLETIAVDGTKLKAFAGKSSFKRVKDLEKELEKLDAELEKLLEAGLSADENEDDELGPDDDGDFHLPPDLVDKKARTARIRQALKEYESIEGGKPEKMSTTDPECRFVGVGKREPGYNGQVSVDTSSGMVVGGYITKESNDLKELNRNLSEVESLAGRLPKRLVADAGYGSYRGIFLAEERNVDVYVPLPERRREGFGLEKFLYNEASDSYVCPEGRELKRKNRTDKTYRTNYAIRNCGACVVRANCAGTGKGLGRLLSVSDYEGLVEKMREKMKTELGKSMLKLRRCYVERLFGHLKYTKKFSQFLVRGRKRVEEVWNFEMAVLNLEILAGIRAS